jgi:6-pyruvoyltetrahydropterin/6-carboxytetrahydropterin synthase
MYRIAKEFTFAMGHRLSRHGGACKNIHGHNYAVIVGLKSEQLNDNGMIMDFSNLKHIVNRILDAMDHALMVSNADEEIAKKMGEIMPFLKILIVPYEPTAENMSKDIFHRVGKILKEMWNVDIDYVTVFETDTSQATYSLD